MKHALPLLFLPLLTSWPDQDAGSGRLGWTWLTGDRLRYDVVLGPVTEVLGINLGVRESSPEGEALLEVQMDHHARRDGSGSWVDTDVPRRKPADPDRWLLETRFTAAVRSDGRLVELRGYGPSREAAIAALPESERGRVAESWLPARMEALLGCILQGGLGRALRPGERWESPWRSPDATPRALTVRTEVLAVPAGLPEVALYRRLRTAEDKEAGHGRILWDLKRGSLVQAHYEIAAGAASTTALVYRADRPQPKTLEQVQELVSKLNEWDYDGKQAVLDLGTASLPCVVIQNPLIDPDDLLPSGSLEPAIDFSPRLGGKRNRVAMGGGSAATEDGVLAGLKWLLRHQAEDGLWGGAESLARCGKTDPKRFAGDCRPPAEPRENRVLLTSAALLAMAGSGYSRLSMDTYDGLRVGAAFDAAIRALTRGETEEGLLDPSLTSHALATWALMESPEGLSAWDWRSLLLFRAVAALRRHQIPGQGWPAQAGGAADVRTSTYALLAMANAARYGLVPPESLREAASWLAPASEKDCSAALARIQAGVPLEDPSLAKLPGALPEGAATPAHEAPWASLFLRQAFAFADKGWTSRVPDILKQVLAAQCREKGQCRGGSWEPASLAPAEGGRIASTAFGMLALESFYFYPNQKGLAEERSAGEAWTAFKAASDANPRKISDFELLKEANRLTRFYGRMEFPWVPELRKRRDELAARASAVRPGESYREARLRLSRSHSLGQAGKEQWGPAIAALKTWLASEKRSDAEAAAADVEAWEAKAHEALQEAKVALSRILAKGDRAEARGHLQRIAGRLRGSKVDAELTEILAQYDEAMEKQLARLLMEFYDLEFGPDLDEAGERRRNQLLDETRELHLKIDPHRVQPPGDLDRYVLSRHAPDSAEAFRRHLARAEKERLALLSRFPNPQEMDRAAVDRLERLEMRLFDLFSLCGVPRNPEDLDQFVGDCLAKHAPGAVDAFRADRCRTYELGAAQALAEIRDAQADFFENDRDANGVRDYWVADVHGLYGLCPPFAPGEAVERTGLAALKLVPEDLAKADRTPAALEGAGLRAPAEPASRGRYQFGALPEFEDASGTWRRYGAGARVSPDRYGFYAVPSKSDLSLATLLVSEKGVRWKKDTAGKVPRGFPADPEREGWARVDRPQTPPGDEALRRLAAVMKGMIESATDELRKEGDRLVRELTDGDRSREDEIVLLAVRKFAPDLLPKVEEVGRAANEAVAGSHLRILMTAEMDFRSNDRDGNMRNDFWVGDVHGLAFLCTRDAEGKFVPSRIQLIENSTAHADASPLRMRGKYIQPGKTPKPRAGYLFSAAAERETPEGWVKLDEGLHVNADGFGFVAVPAEYGKSGTRTFMIGESGTLWAKDTKGKIPRGMPLDPAKDGWERQDR